MAWLLAIPRAGVRALRIASAQELPRLASSIAFYALFSLPALLVAAISVAGVVYGETAARADLVSQVARHLGDDLARTVDSVIEGAVARGAKQALPQALAFVLLFLGASLTFVELQHALNHIWGAAHRGRWFVAIVLKRLVSFGMILLVGAFLVASMAATVGLERFGAWLAVRLPPDVALGVFFAFEPVATFAALAVLFLLVFRVLPDTHVPWKMAWVGAVVTALLLVAAKSVVGRYLRVSDVGSVYGAAGSLAALLVWVYTSCLAVLLGGSFAFAWEQVRSGPAPPASPGP